ncbi:H-NS histone family protein [Burkholderia diffusa]|uniref:H-NS histone family protein n=1 Tax=Burkholderia diffusa TaxID=488732 RepID=UPI002AB296F7|nr:H-NS histone family protein [Burkholderia diffusa]
MFPARRKSAKPPPKYRNPETGETWSGRGGAPAWINGKKQTRTSSTDATDQVLLRRIPALRS